MRFMLRQQISGVPGVQAIDHYQCRGCRHEKRIYLDGKPAPRDLSVAKGQSRTILDCLTALSHENWTVFEQLAAQAKRLRQQKADALLAKLRREIRQGDLPLLAKGFLLELADAPT